MSVMLISSSFVTAILIPPDKFAEGGEANGRAIAYLAHQFFGDIFGTVYDLSTILDSLVCRRVGDGWSFEYRASLLAALRHGAGVGQSSTSARDRDHRRSLLPSHLSSMPTLMRRAALTRQACWF